MEEIKLNPIKLEVDRELLWSLAMARIASGAYTTGDPVGPLEEMTELERAIYWAADQLVKIKYTTQQGGGMLGSIDDEAELSISDPLQPKIQLVLSSKPQSNP